jgi:solute carrier family 25 folate transporter 32
MPLVNASVDQAIAGFTAGAVSTIILHPLDLLKTRFQIDEKRRNSIVRSVTAFARSEGITGLYRGLSPNFVGTSMSWGLYFLFYSKFKELHGERLRPDQHLTASAAAGSIITQA